MKGWGTVLVIGGLLMTIVAFNMDTSVYSYGGDVNNLGLLQKQMMVLHTGLAAFIAGSVLVVGSAFQAAGNGVVSQGPRVRSHESAEERDERLAGVRRLNQIIGFSLIGLVLLGVVLVIAAS